MPELDAQELLKKYLSGHCTREEKALLETWYIRHEGKNLPEISQTVKDQQLEEVWLSLPIHQQNYKVMPLWTRIAAAASVLIILSFGSYFLLHKVPPKQTAQNQQDLAPGRNQATLTLANGKKIILTKGLNGKLAQQGNTQIAVNSGNAIAYNTSQGQPETIIYNTLSTAKGEQSPYPLILADGTRVWLNAASSITFPTAFPGRERVVTVTGEADFQVAHHALQPFKIRVAGQTVEDIGTEFNINAYPDEPAVKVTLASGKAKVIKNEQEVILNPGQEAVTMADNAIAIKAADLDVVFAWRNGLFLYDNESLASIMRKVARWYDVDVVYQGADKNKLFGGGISRYKNVSQVLRKLELTGGVHFTIEGRRIIARK